MSPLTVKQGVKPRFPYRWMRTVFVFLFVLAGLVFLWTPTRWLIASFQEAQKFKGIRLPTSTANTLQPSGFFASPDSPATAKKPVTFRLLAPAAKEVGVGGTFNNFDSGKNPLTRRQDGLWEAVVDLPPGRYLYKFKVDGEWELDPTNADSTQENRGGSVLEIR